MHCGSYPQPVKIKSLLKLSSGQRQDEVLRFVNIIDERCEVLFALKSNVFMLQCDSLHCPNQECRFARSFSYRVAWRSAGSVTEP